MAKRYWITDVQLGMLTAMKNEGDRIDIINKIIEGQSLEQTKKFEKIDSSFLDDVEVSEEISENTDTSGYMDHVKNDSKWGADNQEFNYDREFSAGEAA